MAAIACLKDGDRRVCHIRHFYCRYEIRVDELTPFDVKKNTLLHIPFQSDM